MNALNALKRFAVAIALCLSSSSLLAQSDLAKGFQFGAGAFASIYFHEVGHAVTAKALGADDIHIQVPRQDCIFCGGTYSTFPKSVVLSPAQNQMRYASGLIAQNLAAQIVVQNRGMYQSAFGQGIMGTNIVSNVRHVYSYYTKRVGENGWQGNDLDGYAQSGGNPHVFSALLLTYTAYSLHRMRQKEIPLFGVSLTF
jgi:hypothetical protein